MKSPLLRWAPVPAFLYCRAWLIFHFVCTALYLAPVGELKVRTFDFVTSYIEPRFGQRWGLFAPDPDGKSRHLLVACKLRRAEAPPHETPLYDVTESFYSAPWRTRLGPDYRLMRAYLATALFFEGDSASFDVLEYQAKSDPEAAKELRPTLARRREARAKYTEHLAVRIASAECKNQFPDAVVSEVQPVIDIVRAPARLASDPQPEAPVRLDFGWHTVESNVRFL
jgi:hypothetical protein